MLTLTKRRGIMNCNSRMHQHDAVNYDVFPYLRKHQKFLEGVSMISFFVCLAILIGGYFIYGQYVTNVFGPDDRETPAVTMEDGVDYVVMPTWRIFLIQLLNIAGLGPIWGAVGGAMWGPSVFLWITFGTVFVGAVHDFASGFMSMRHEGKSVPELTGMYMGNTMKQVMRVFSTILLFMVGVVFAVGPAGLLTYPLSEQHPNYAL